MKRRVGAARGHKYREMRSIGKRTLLLCGIWLVLTEGSTRGWGLALPAIAVAVFSSLALRPPGAVSFRIGAAVLFLPYFVRVSVLAALDVALRAFRGPEAVSPGSHELDWRLSDGPQRIFLSAIVGLLPGTLGTARTRSSLRLHLLDRRALDVGALRRLEWHVGRLFGETLALDDSSSPSR